LAHLLPAPSERKEWDLSRRMVVLLAAAAVAVAMLAVSGSASGQDAAQGGSDGTSVGVSDRGDPVIKPRDPRPGERIEDRRPTIKAKVFDRDSRLEKKDIKLKLDGDRVPKNHFTYKTRKELLTHTPGENLSLGKHTVKITAGPRGDRATRSWSFKIRD
jgi:hypothetical protein